MICQIRISQHCSKNACVVLDKDSSVVQVFQGHQTILGETKSELQTKTEGNTINITEKQTTKKEHWNEQNKPVFIHENFVDENNRLKMV